MTQNIPESHSNYKNDNDSSTKLSPKHHSNHFKSITPEEEIEYKSEPMT